MSWLIAEAKTAIVFQPWQSAEARVQFCSYGSCVGKDCRDISAMVECKGVILQPWLSAEAQAAVALQPWPKAEARV